MIPTTKKTTVSRKIDNSFVSEKRLAKASNPDPRHTEQVTKLSLILFDKLTGIQSLVARDRFLLEVAAMLHDIGWSQTTSGGHHKHSRDMIMDA